MFYETIKGNFLNFLPSNKLTFTRRFEQVQQEEPKANRFLKNPYSQRYIELMLPIPEICFGMLLEDTLETSYYKVGVS